MLANKCSFANNAAVEGIYTAASGAGDDKCMDQHDQLQHLSLKDSAAADSVETQKVPESRKGSWGSNLRQLLSWRSQQSSR